MFLAHEGALDKKDKDGVSERDRMLTLLKRRDPRAIKALTPLDYPHEVHYLRTYGAELKGRSGPDRAISYTEIESWARLTGRRLAEHEVPALVRVVDVMDFPPALPEEESDG